MKFPSAQARAALASVFGAALLSGCASIVRQSYRDVPAGPGVRLSPYSGATQVFGTLDLEGDETRLEHDGYVRIGVSSFKTGGHLTLDQIQETARDFGADIVLCAKARPGSREPLQPLVTDNKGNPSALAPYVHISGSIVPTFGGAYGGSTSVGGGMFNFKGNVTSSGIPGISAEEMAAINEQRYVFTLSFWRRGRA